MPNRRKFVTAGTGALLLLSCNLRAHGQVTMRRIGLLSGFARAEIEASLGLLRPELEGLGWVDGRNIVFEVRTTEGKNDQLPSMAAELISHGPDLILVQTLPAIRALMQATKTVPIVMIGVGNPVEMGIVAAYGRPGGNVTGSSVLASEIGGKLLQLLKEAAPRLRSVAVFVNPTNEHAASFVKSVGGDAMALGMRAQFVEVSGPVDFEPAFVAIRNANTESILLAPEPLILSKRDVIADFAQAHGLPMAVVGTRRVLPAGGLIALGASRTEYAKATARYVDRILRGAKPGDLPVEQPARFELAINLKTARALGLTIPQTLLLRADEVIQ